MGESYQQRREREERQRIEARRQYEAGPHFAMWRRFNFRQRAMLDAEIGRSKPAFEFVQMVLTTALASAIAPYIADAGHRWRGDDIFSKGFAVLAAVGLVIIVLWLVVATYRAAVRFAVMVSSDVADAFNVEFSASTVDWLCGFVVACVLAATVVLGAVSREQAIKAAASQEPAPAIESR